MQMRRQGLQTLTSHLTSSSGRLVMAEELKQISRREVRVYIRPNMALVLSHWISGSSELRILSNICEFLIV